MVIHNTETASTDLHALQSVFLIADESKLKLLVYCHLGMISLNMIHKVNGLYMFTDGAQGSRTLHSLSDL